VAVQVCIGRCSYAIQRCLNSERLLGILDFVNLVSVNYCSSPTVLKLFCDVMKLLVLRLSVGKCLAHFLRPASCGLQISLLHLLVHILSLICCFNLIVD